VKAGAVSPQAVPTPPANSSVITVKVGSDRTGTSGVTNLAGVVLGLYDTATSTTLSTGTGNSATCTSDANGDCSWIVSNTAAGSGLNANRDRRFFIKQISAPSGYFTNLTLGTGTTVATDNYVFQTGTQLRSGTTYSSTVDFMISTGLTNNEASGGIWQDSRVNPVLPPQCGLHVAIIADLSNSVGANLPNLKGAATTMVNSLTGTPSTVSLFTFATAAPAAGAANINRPALMSVSTAAGAATVNGFINGWALPGGTDGGTNWDRAFAVVAGEAQHYDLVVVITDGDPTYYGDPVQGPGNRTRFREVENGIFSANAIKAEGTRMVAMGVGAGVSNAASGLNLRAISGTTLNSDYYQTSDYSAAGAALRALALGNCLGTVTVVKQVLPPGTPANSTTGATPAGGWTFTASADSGVTVAPSSGQTDAGTGALNFALTFPGGTTTSNFTAAETQQATYTLQTINGFNATCIRVDTGAAVTSSNNGALGFTVTANSAFPISCTVYNVAAQPPATVVVNKVWNVDGTLFPNGQQPAELSASLLLNGTAQQFGTIVGGFKVGDTVSINETTSISPTSLCTITSKMVTDDNGTSVNRTLPYSATLPGATNSYTITNTVTCPARLTLMKDVVNGPALPTAWTLSASAPPPALAGPIGVSGTATANVTPLVTYALSESAGDPRYVQLFDPNAVAIPGSTISWSCQQVNPTTGAVIPGFSDGLNGGVTIPRGFAVVCTAQNETSSLSLVKHVINDNGGTATAANWDLTATPTGTPPAGLTSQTVPGSETVTPTNTIFVRPGQPYSLTESSFAGYTLTGISCVTSLNPTPAALTSITLAVGESGICTFTNDDQPGQLTLKKVVDPDASGSGKVPADWTLTATPTPPITGQGPVSGNGDPSTPGGVNAVPVFAGTYVLTESGPSGFTPGTWGCVGASITGSTVTVPNGGNVTCTITNTAIAPKLTLVKVVNHGTTGDTTPATAWTLTASGPSTISGPTGDPSVTGASVQVGTYALSETGPPGFDASDWVCTGAGLQVDPTHITLAEGQAATCTITNTAQQPHLTLKKDVVNGTTGTAAAADFTLTGTNGTTTVTGPGNSAAVTSQPVSIGTYNLTETGPTGYTPSNWVCTGGTPGTNSVAIALGDNVTCTITNTWNPIPTASKTVASTVQNADGSWTITYNLVVTNPDGDLSAVYSLSDTPGFGTGITITGAVVTPPSGATAPTWDGTGTVQLATDRALAAGATETWTIALTANVTTAATGADRACSPGGTPGAGFFNSATITSGSHTQETHDCSAPVSPVLTKTPGTVTADANGTSWDVTYTITVANPSPTIGLIYSLEDTPLFDSSVTINSAEVTSAPSGVTPINTFIGGVLAIVDGRALAAGATDTYTIKVVATPPTGTDLSSSVADCSAAGAGHGFYNLGTATSGQDTFTADACLPIPHWTLTKSSVPAPGSTVFPGDTITYTLTVTNTGTAVISGAKVQDDLSNVLDNATLGTVGSGGSITGTTLTWAVPDVAVDGTQTLSYTVTINTGAYGVALTNVATPQSPGGNCTTEAECTTTHYTPKWELTKTSDPASGDTVKPGDTITYTLTATNVGPVAVTGDHATDNFSQVAPYATLDTTGLAAQGLTYDPTTQTLTWALPTIPVGGSVSVQYTVTVNPGVEGVVITNLATPTEPEGGCRTAADCTTTHPVPQITKTFDHATQHLVGGAWDGSWDVFYKVSVKNPSTSQAIDYSLVDTPFAPPGGTLNDASVTAAINSVTGSFLASLSPVFAAGVLTIIPASAQRPLPANSTDTVMVKVNVSLPVDSLPTTCEAEGGVPNVGTATFVQGQNSTEISAEDCGSLPEVPTPSVAKTVTSTTQQADGTWTIVYDVAVTDGDATLATQYDLTDTLAFGSGITVNSATVTGPAGAVLTPGWNGASQPEIISGRFINAGATDHYTVTVNATVTTTATVDDRTCTPGENGGFANTADVALHSAGAGPELTPQLRSARTRALAAAATDPTHAEACSEPVSPVLTKTPVSVVANADGKSWDVTYKVSVADPSSTTGLVYSLSDTPLFDSSITVNSAKVTASSDGTSSIPGIINTWDGTTLSIVNARALAAGGTDTYTIVVNATTPAVVPPSVGDCSDSGAGHGFYNLATATSGDDTFTADACQPVPHWTLSKTSDPLPGSDVDAGSTITYTLTATNTSTITVSGAKATDTLPTDVTLVTPLASGLTDNGDGTLTWAIPDIAEGKSVSVSYQVTVSDTAVGKTLKNVVVPSTPGGSCTSADDCTTSHLVKQLIVNVENSCVRDAAYLHYTIASKNVPNAASLPVTVTWRTQDGTVARVDTIPAGQLSGDLLWPGMVLNSDGIAISWPGWRALEPSDFPLKPGVSIYGTQIEDPSLPSFAFRLPMAVTFEMNPSETVTVQYPGVTPAGCAVPREPDLHIAKTASVTSVPEGGTFSYDINVNNVSTLGVAYPVTLSDPIPSTLKVTGITTASTGFPHWQNCAVTGTDSNGFGGTLNCDLSAALGVSAAAPVITLTVTVASPVSGDTISNTATTCWMNPSIPTEAQKCANSTVVVTVTHAPVTTLPNTGVAATQMGWLALVLLLGGGLLVTTGTVWRRRPRRH
jgi:uncharacterized repeat protein (TIGR01451 family)